MIDYLTIVVEMIYSCGMSLTSVSADTPAEEIGAVLDRDGAVIVERLFPPELLDALIDDIRPDLDGITPAGGAFFGRRCKRLAGVVRRSPRVADIAADPRLLAVIEPPLLRNALTIQLHLGAILEVWPGGEPQPLHQDVGIYWPYLQHRADGPEFMLTTMTALSDFTAENGATRLIPGSHRWPPDRQPTESETVQAVMPRGSILIWYGSVQHGMAVNRSDQPRTGLTLGYVCGWLRQEENMYLTVPPDLARGMPTRMQQLLGYQSHGLLVGWADGLDSEVQTRAPA
jgi:hypothetical protein